MCVSGVNRPSPFLSVIFIVNDHNWQNVGSIFHLVVVNIKFHCYTPNYL